MQNPVSIQAKKQFLQWFISHYKMNTQEVNWFLEDLIEDERALFHLHFVQDIEHCPKGIIISTHVPDDVSFLFFKGSVQTNDVYTAYHELHLYHEEAFYVQINFPQSNLHSLYKAVLEEEMMQREKDKVYAEQLLKHLLMQGEKQTLEREVNEALDSSDSAKFIHYSTQLKKYYGKS